MVDEDPEGSKAKRVWLSGESLVVYILKSSTRGSMIKSYGTFEGAEELFLSSLTDFHSLHICVVSTDGCVWSLAWHQLDTKLIPFLTLSKLYVL